MTSLSVLLLLKKLLFFLCSFPPGATGDEGVIGDCWPGRTIVGVDGLLQLLGVPGLLLSVDELLEFGILALSTGGGSRGGTPR